MNDTSHGNGTVALKGRTLFMPAVLTGFTVIAHISVMWFAAGYAELFRELQAPLPLVTKVFLPYSVLYFVLPVLSVVGLVARCRNFQIPTWAFVVAAVLSMLIMPIFVYGMYMPFLQLSEAIE